MLILMLTSIFLFSCFVLKTHSDGITHVHQDLQAATVNPDPSLKEFEGATLRYASLKLR